MENISSKTVWSINKQMNGDPKAAKKHIYVTENQVANVLIMNGKPEIKL